MRLTALPLVSLLLCVLAIPVHAALPSHDSQNQPLPSLAPMLDGALPAVVNIFTRSRVEQQLHPLMADPLFRQFFGIQPRERYTQSLGSGVIVDADKGYILTNNHVVEQAVEISVNLNDGRTLKATLVGADPETDVAVVKVDPEGLSALPMSSDAQRVGDFVVAIGNPFGLGSTVTSGIVSAIGRSGLGIEGYEDFIQTDASINPGNSGGALVNLRGELIGINTAILSKSGGNVGIGFAIPISMAREVMQQLIDHGEVRRGQLGIEAQDLTPKLATAFGLEHHRGAVVTRVTPGSAAERSDLRSGDIITEINGRSVRDASDVRNSVGLVRVGQAISMGILRNGESKRLDMMVEEPELIELSGERLHANLAGAKLVNVTDNRGSGVGVAVIEIERGSAAWGSGLRKGDLIAQVNRANVRNLDEFARQVKGADTLLINIQRRDGALYLLIR